MADVLPPPEQKARNVREMFDRIAPSYDRMNGLLTARMDQRWRKDLVRRLAIGPRDRVLDLACGTGDFTVLCRAQGAEVVALDFSPRMLEVARARVGAGVEFIEADAQAMPLPSGTFDVVVSGFALRNLVSLPAAFAEMARVLRPGGRLGLLEVDRPRHAALRAGHSLYFDRVVPVVGGLLSDRQAYRYLPRSTAYLPPARELGRMLRAAGFQDIRKRTYLGGAAQSLRAVKP